MRKLEKKPNVALRKVREIMGFTQAQFGAMVGMTGAYIQAVELGVRGASPELAQRVAGISGVDPASILTSSELPKAVDGTPYNQEAHQKYLHGEDALLEQELQALLLPLRRLFEAAAKEGKLQMAKLMVRGQLEEIADTLRIRERIDKALSDGATVFKMNYGAMRANPALMEFLNFKDDPAKTDDAVIVLEQKGASEKWFDDSLFPESLRSGVVDHKRPKNM